MTRISLVVLLACLVVAIGVILTQHGHATRATWLSLIPLGLYLLYWAVSWLVSVLRK